MAKAATTKAKTRVDKAQLGRQQAELERNADIGRDGYDGSHKIVVCYNRACPDYGRERRGAEPCGCKRTRVPTAARG